MTMLPDVEQSTYDQFEQERLRRELEQKQQSFSLQSAIGEKIAGLQSLLGGAAQTEAPPPPAPSAPEPAPAPEPVAAPPVQPAPEPPPAPAPPVPEPEPGPAPEPVAQPAPPTPAPVRPEAPSAGAQGPISAPSAPPASGSGLTDWIGSAMGAAVRSGADMQQFASGLQPGAGDPIGSAMGAALRAGADMQQFASSLPPPPAPEPVAAPTVGGVGRTDTAGRERRAATGVTDRAAVRQGVCQCASRAERCRQSVMGGRTGRAPSGLHGPSQLCAAQLRLRVRRDRRRRWRACSRITQPYWCLG
jgi:hypothetical protein